MQSEEECKSTESNIVKFVFLKEKKEFCCPLNSFDFSKLVKIIIENNLEVTKENVFLDTEHVSDDVDASILKEMLIEVYEQYKDEINKFYNNIKEEITTYYQDEKDIYDELIKVIEHEKQAVNIHCKEEDKLSDKVVT